MSEDAFDHSLIPIDGIPLNVAVFRFVKGEFIIVDFNGTAQKTDDVKREDIIGKPVLEVFPGVEELGLIDAMSRVRESGKQEDINLVFYEDERINGWREIDINRMENGELLVFYKDMSQEQEREEQLKSLGEIVDNSTSEVFIFDAEDFSFSYANKEAQRNTGYTLEEMKRMTPVDIKPDFDREYFMAMVRPLLDGLKDSHLFETIHRRKNGEVYNAEIRLQIIYFKGRKQFVVMAHDITTRVKMEEMLHKLATVDSLTGIYNRHQINEELDIEMERAGRYKSMFALVMFDLDYFKNINDTYGHDTGDYVLKEFSRIVSQDIREVDRFGRWGGEEFVLILPELNEEQALKVTEKLREDVASFEFKDIPKVTVSAGVTICQMDDSKKDILKRVDDAMYQAKKAGRNTIKYN